MRRRYRRLQCHYYEEISFKGNYQTKSNQHIFECILFSSASLSLPSQPEASSEGLFVFSPLKGMSPIQEESDLFLVFSKFAIVSGNGKLHHALL